jgi:hypothetical protein
MNVALTVLATVIVTTQVPVPVHAPDQPAMSNQLSLRGDTHVS